MSHVKCGMDFCVLVRRFPVFRGLRPAHISLFMGSAWEIGSLVGDDNLAPQSSQIIYSLILLFHKCLRNNLV